VADQISAVPIADYTFGLVLALLVLERGNQG
jgi:hypothetical protein